MTPLPADADPPEFITATMSIFLAVAPTSTRIHVN